MAQKKRWDPKKFEDSLIQRIKDISNPKGLESKKIVIGISGASSVQYGTRLIEILYKYKDIETTLIISKSAKKIIQIETDYSIKEIEGLATTCYNEDDFTAKVANGSHQFIGMIIAPCSMKTIGSMSNGVSDNLISIVADVCLKEERKLILTIHETPLNQIHLNNMLIANKAGAIILPACPGFYSRPKTIDDILNIMAGRALDLMGIKIKYINDGVGPPRDIKI